jgi:carbon-monoxide dehydrogenase medium subunit
MKAAPFAYKRAADVAEVCTLLREHGDDARVLAGGQTLLATLAMRLSEPAILIDVGAIADLRGIRLAGTQVRIGAMTRHADIERSALIADKQPLLAVAAPHIAHSAIRNRGTIGGSLAFADPAAEWPACAVALDAVLVLSNGEHERRVAAGDFFQDLYLTDLRPDEIIIAIEFPLAPSERRFGFAELARRHGDYATVGVAIALNHAADAVSNCRIVFFGVGNTPVRARTAEAAMEHLGPAGIVKATQALSEDLHPTADLTTSAEMKLHLARVLLRRQLTALLKKGETR